MTPARRFALGLAVVATAVGVIRGAIIGWLYHLSAATTLRVAIGQVGISIVWLPIGLCALWIMEARITRGSRFAVIAILGAAMVGLEPALVPLLGVQGAHPPAYWTLFVNRSDTNVLFYVAVVAAAAAVAARARQLAAELSVARLETAVADAQLHVLTLQLHPHFLFNALNLVSQLAYENVDAARRTIANLRSLLRESLRHALHREVSLAEELRFVRAYLEIQEARFRGRLFSTISVADGTERAAVPHLLLQPLVENAIVHGLGLRAEAGRLEVAARRAGSRLVLSVRDDGDGIRGPLREGLGLGNARLRLDQVFSGDYRLEVSAAPERGVIVSIDIPYRDIRTDSTALSDEIFADGSAPIAEEDRAMRAPLHVSPWLIIAGVWTVTAVLWTELRTGGQLLSMADGWSTIAVSEALSAALWTVLTPLVVRFAHWSEVARQRSMRLMFIHAVGAIVVGVGHTALWIGALYLVGSRDLLPAIRSMFAWMIWDAGAYAAIVSSTTFVALSARIRDARVIVARERARLAEARLAALRLRLQPRILIGALDALEHVVSIDAEKSEEAITRMGDLLRHLLAQAEHEWVGADDEAELLTAYLDVVNAWRRREGDDRPTVTVDCSDEPIPAMLLLTMAASIGGDPDVVSIRANGGSVIVEVSARRGVIEHPAVAELSERLGEVYRGAERLLSGRAPSGGHFIRVEIPASRPDHGHAEGNYDVAIA